jgi:hypothetical protein
LFLVYPFSFEGKLIQYIGRVQRSEVTPVIYDYRDHRIDYLEKLFQKRNAYYKKYYLHGSLFDQPEKEGTKDSGTFIYEERISIPIERLEFRFGAVAFKHMIPKINTEQEFEVDNAEMRPEFDVLKPYFAKILKAKKVKIDVFAQFQNGVPVIQTASSHDISKINREIIDSVKFRFVTKGIIGKISFSEENMLDINQIQANEQKNPLYVSENDLLDDILKNKSVKHHKQLVYLSKKHENTILKLRFVLTPFSFIFLISGKQQYHIIWETLDTEEATFIWHVDKRIAVLKAKLKEIDADLGTIRTKGRQQYMGIQGDNFTWLIKRLPEFRR